MLHEITFYTAPLLLAALFLPAAPWQRFLRTRLFAPAETAWCNVSRLPVPVLYGFLFAWGFGIAAALWLFVRRPEAHIHDEAAYLLAADTFARGRLTNPALPETIRAHFEALHIIVAPSYMAKYPPGQGLLLALGIVLCGNPATGLWLNAGAVCAASLYALLPLVPRRVAVLAAMLAPCHPAVLKWTQSFWGGNLALFAGLLLLGASLRLAGLRPSPPAPLPMRHGEGGVPEADLLRSHPPGSEATPDASTPPSPCRMGRGAGGEGYILGASLALLANCRPFEGLIATSLTLLPVAPALFRGLRTRPRPWLRVLLPAVAVLAATAVLMLAYNARVSGKPARMPYAVHEDAYGVVPLFLFQHIKPIPATLRHDSMRFINAYTCVYGYLGQRGAAINLWRGATDKADTLARSAFQCFDPTVYWLDTPARAHPLTDPWRFIPALLLLPGLLLAVRKNTAARYAVIALAVFVGVLCLGTFINPHYGSPVGGFALLVWVLAWRYTGTLRTRAGRHRRFGRTLQRAFIGLYVLSAVSCGAFFGGNEWEWTIQDRRPVQKTLAALPGNHLVLVYYGAANVKTSAEWVYNGADLRSQRIVWARYLTPGENTSLLRYFGGRRVWLLDVTIAAKPRLYLYDRARMATLPFPTPRTISPETAAKVAAGLPTKPAWLSGIAALPAREQALYHAQTRERSRVRRLLETGNVTPPPNLTPAPPLRFGEGE